MLGLGSSTHYTTVLVFLSAAASLYLTDILKTVKLNRFVSNALILAIVFLSLGGILRYRTVDLAIGIARLLQLVQIVVLFQEKNQRNRWHILMISLLQVIVATAFQQSLAFGLLLLLYVFANLCALTLIFLHDENAYFKRHSFVRGAFQLHSSELRQKQDWSRLLKIAFATFIVGPLSLILSYRENDEQRRPRDGNSSHKPRDAKFGQTYAASRQSEVRWEAAAPGTSGWTDLWEDLEGDDTSEVSDVAIPILTRQVAQERENDHNNHGDSNWPLLHATPIFSGGTNRKTGLIGGQRELFGRLFRATLWSLFIGVIVFLLIPRFSGIEMFGQRLSYERWNSAATAPISSVGFTEEIRLGSLGNVLQNYQEVLSIALTQPTVSQVANAEGARDVWADYPPLNPNEPNYDAIEGKTFYLRGVVVDRYEPGRGRWSRSGLPPFSPPQGPPQNQRPPSQQWPTRSTNSSPLDFFGWASRPQQPPNDWEMMMQSRIVPQTDVAEMFFAEKSDLVHLRITTQPLDSRVLFTVWPFYILGREMNRVAIFPDRIEIPDGRRGRRPRPFVQGYYTTAFRGGEQMDLVPCTEPINTTNLLQISRDQMPKLVALAQEWDSQAKLPPADLIGRARNLETRLKHDERFQYQLGGIVRDTSLDPLEDFVAANPRGHCEFFAGTLAMMLRSVGIPSRVCIGYKTVAFTKGSEGYMVRQSDAHSWVEVYISPIALPGNLTQAPFANHWRKGGWLRLDATPEQEADMLRGFSMSLSDWIHAVQIFWQNYVMNMDGSKQSSMIYEPFRQLFETVKNAAQTNQWSEIGSSILQRYQEIFVQIRAGTIRQTDIFLIVLPLAILFGGIYVLVRLGVLRLFRRLLIPLDVQERKRQASVDFYVQMERLLSKVSLQRRPSETQQEFSTRAIPFLIERIRTAEKKVDLESLNRCAANIVEAFYRVRFGNLPLNDKDLAKIGNDLSQLKTATDRT